MPAPAAKRRQPDAANNGLGPRTNLYEWEAVGKRKGKLCKDESRPWWKVGGRKSQGKQNEKTAGLLAATDGIIDERLMAYFDMNEGDDNGDFMGLG